MTIVVESPAKGLVQLTLNRPEKHNALDGPMVAECLAALEQIALDRTCRVLMIRAAGKDFCAGADIGWMRKMASASLEENQKDALQLATFLYRLHTLPIPVIALVHGATCGGGMGIVSASDMAVASEDATFAFPETRIGLCPSVVSPWVSAILGERQTRYYFLTGEIMTAKTAESLGLIQQVVSPASLSETGIRLADRLLQMSPHAIAESRKLLSKVSRVTPNEDLMHWTASHLARIRMSADAHEGLLAFTEKRNPVWSDS